VAKGKLDHRYFSHFAEADIFVCHEGAELKRIEYDKQKQRTRYRFLQTRLSTNGPSTDPVPT